MNTIKGFTQAEIARLAEAAEDAARRNAPLSAVFADFAARSGRAKGSVRNFYYEFVRMCRNDAALSARFFKQLPPVSRPRAFTAEEERTLLEAIARGKTDNRSARRTIIDLAGGDQKLILRYQNKYRNILRSRRRANLPAECVRVPDPVLESLCSAINGLVARLTAKEQAENARLRSRIVELESQLSALRPSNPANP